MQSELTFGFDVYQNISLKCNAPVRNMTQSFPREHAIWTTLEMCIAESLQDRTFKTDMCETYKYLHNFYKTDPKSLFIHPQRQLRGHSLKLAKSYCRTDTKKYFFTNRVIDGWNNLSEKVISAPSLESFKNNLRSSPQAEEDKTTK